MITPIITCVSFVDDTTPPITTHSLDPPTPDGDNGWYVSDVTVTLTATDDMSGVNMTYYRIDGGVWLIYDSFFIISEDEDDIVIEYYSVDNTGNTEQIKQVTIKIDKKRPCIYSYGFSWYLVEDDIWLLRLDAGATDETSGMNRVEFYTYTDIIEIVYGSGPYYIFETLVDYDYHIKGVICKINITDEYVKFYAIWVRVLPFYNITYKYVPWIRAYDNAGNYMDDIIPEPPDYYEKRTFKWYKFPNDYEGYIGSYYIDAIFKKYPTAVTSVPNLQNFEPNNIFLRFLDHFPLLQRLLDSWRYHLL
jgi:hypothetical protein